MSNLTESVIKNAMLSSTEGYVFSVVDSIEFELCRKLNNDEQQQVYQSVSRKIEGAVALEKAL